MTSCNTNVQHFVSKGIHRECVYCHFALILNAR
uniref:Uncharacterized protein n=1 Tax=Anguilla anguilla TaxID=7936 RepID=A0A0E9XIR6_ANGAN